MTLEKVVIPPAPSTRNNIVTNLLFAEKKIPNLLIAEKKIPNLLIAERKVHLSIKPARQVASSHCRSEQKNSELVHKNIHNKNSSAAGTVHNNQLLRSHKSDTQILVREARQATTPTAVVVVKTSHIQSAHCPYTCPRNKRHEIPPPMPRSGGQSSRSSAIKRAETKEPNSDGNSRILQTETSLSGVDVESSVKGRQTRSADGRPRKSTTSCSFFYFIRRKKEKSSRSSSPDIKDKKSNPQNNRARWSISCSSAQSEKKSERTPSPSHKNRRPSGQSQVSSRLPLTPLSSNPSLSITSPSVPLLDSTSSPVSKKRPQYTSRSRPKHRRDRRRHRTSKRASQTQPEDSLKLEDLPPHPSLFRKTIVTISSEPDTEYLIPRASSNRTDNSHENSSSKITCTNSDANSRSRKNSKAESSVVVKSVATTSSGSGPRKESQKEESRQNLKLKSQHSASKTDIEEDSHCLTTSSSEAHSNKFRSHSLPSLRGDHYQTDVDTRVITDAEDFEFNPSDMLGPLNLSLCGCGFLGMYHLGAISVLTLRGPTFVDRLEKIAGASAGALMAAVLVTAPDKIEESAEHIHNLAKEIRKKPLGALTPGYNFTRSLRYMVEDILPEDAHEVAKGKLFVSLTNAETKENELMSDFESRDELIDALVASCYIPVYAGIKLPMLRGQKYIDGGLSDNLPKFDTGRTITVSPFDGKSDIGPRVGQEIEKKAHFINVHNQDIQVNLNNIKKGVHAFFPPKRQMLQEYFERGRRDASRFLIREGLYEVTLTSQTKAVLYESSV
ncbi:unnamed protein product [Candidula unifasciata]|uniref:PNPLA domain-containing protein n=1 Tax=Candidula unifasciata TaxID=100452 RepID=A0A8S3YTE0_9EUPU|nr:unnamed protein product [Candidula unifasciata]